MSVNIRNVNTVTIFKIDASIFHSNGYKSDVTDTYLEREEEIN